MTDPTPDDNPPAQPERIVVDIVPEGSSFGVRIEGYLDDRIVVGGLTRDVAERIAKVLRQFTIDDAEREYSFLDLVWHLQSAFYTIDHLAALGIEL